MLICWVLTSAALFDRCPSRMVTLLTTGTMWVLFPASPTAESQGHAVGAQKPPKEWVSDWTNEMSLPSRSLTLEGVKVQTAWGGMQEHICFRGRHLRPHVCLLYKRIQEITYIFIVLPFGEHPSRWNTDMVGNKHGNVLQEAAGFHSIAWGEGSEGRQGWGPRTGPCNRQVPSGHCRTVWRAWLKRFYF